MSGFCGKGPFGEQPPFSCIVNKGPSFDYVTKQCTWKGVLTSPVDIHSIPNCIELNYSFDSQLLCTTCRCYANKLPSSKASYVYNNQVIDHNKYMLYSNDPVTGKNSTDSTVYTINYPDNIPLNDVNYSVSSTNLNPKDYGYGEGWNYIKYPNYSIEKEVSQAEQYFFGTKKAEQSAEPSSPNFKDIALKKDIEKMDKTLDELDKKHKNKKRDRFELLDME